MRVLPLIALLIAAWLRILFPDGWRAPSLHAEPNENAAKGIRRGVSLAGPEFGVEGPAFSNRNPGTFGHDYTYNSERTVSYFCERNMRLFRIPVRWERLQPVLGHPLDENELRRLKRAIDRARKHGGETIIDLHNYGRYVLDRGAGPNAWIIDQSSGGETPVTGYHLADFWKRMSHEFHANPSVYAYGLMNEPHDMGHADWKSISQLVVNSVRSTGDRKLLLISGDAWSHSSTFGEVNGAKAWIADPAQNVAYEAHCYFDRDHSGRYADSFDRELVLDPKLTDRPARRLQPFIEWCRTNNVRGFIGEFGIPANDPRWQPLLRQFVGLLDQHGIEGCYWAAGEWWNDYPLSIQPKPGSNEDRPQLAALRLSSPPVRSE